jgi:hypothetical protein
MAISLVAITVAVAAVTLSIMCTAKVKRKKGTETYINLDANMLMLTSSFRGVGEFRPSSICSFIIFA